MYTFWKDYFPWTLILMEAGKLTAQEAENFPLSIKPIEQERFL